jgi:DNA repair protein RecO (recombination protein O)
MGIEKIEAIVIRSYPLGDTSRIVQLLSPERGRLAVVAKGVRGPKSRFGAALEPFTTIGAVIYYKPDRDLQFLSQAEIRARRAVLASSILRFAYASAVVELLDQALAGEEPPGALYDLVQSTLVELEHAPEDALRGVFMGYVARLLAMLGYRPELAHCVTCRGEVGEGAAWDAGRGGVVCARCAADDATATPFSAAARATLAAFLAAGPASAAPTAAPATAVSTAPASPALERALGDELARALDAFMRMHLPRYRGLRSLKVVREVSAPD